MSSTAAARSPQVSQKPRRRTPIAQPRRSNRSNQAINILALSAGERTRTQILAAARAHFAEHGLRGASIRTITRMAGVNSALISYHFGSKQRLYEEVLRDCVMRLNYPRLEALDELERAAGDKPVPLEPLLRAYASPYASGDPQALRDAAIYRRFYGRFYTEPTEELLRMTRTKFITLHRRYVEAMAHALPQVDKADLYHRFASLNAAMAYLTAETGALEQISDGACSTRPQAAFWERFFQTWCTMLSAPSLHPSPSN